MPPGQCLPSKPDDKCCASSINWRPREAAPKLSGRGAAPVRAAVLVETSDGIAAVVVGDALTALVP